MKKIFLILCLILGSAALFSQGTAPTGLDGIIVEKYYVANSADATAAGANLPVGSTTYRIYVDLKTDWQLQSIQSSSDFAHPIIFSSSTGKFYNATDGKKYANLVSFAGLTTNNSTLMLDSWLSAGAASDGNHYGIMKNDDTDGAIAVTGLTMKNTNPSPAVSVKDGILTLGTTPAVWTESSGAGVFLNPLDGPTSTGNVNITASASFYLTPPAGVTGADAQNRVLIGQFTTSGTFTYQFNIGIRNNSLNKNEYITPEFADIAEGQYYFAGLKGSKLPPSPPTNVNILSVLPTPNTYLEGATVTMVAHAEDNVSISKVEFFAGSESIGVATRIGVTNDYQLIWISTPTAGPLTAVATDDEDTQTPSAPWPITVASAASYLIPNQKVTCQTSDFFYVPVQTKGVYSIDSAIGFDLVMKFNPAKVKPTGVIRVNRDLIIDSTYASSVTRIAGDSITISLFLNSSAPAATRFGYTGHQTGKVLRVEFAKTVNFLPGDSVIFNVPSFIESYITGTSVNKGVDQGYFVTYAEKYFTGTLKFWADNSAVTYTGDPATSLITNIRNWAGTYSVQPDAVKGEFVYDITKGLTIEIVRQIADTTDVQPVINGYDAYLTQRVVLSDPNFRPNVYQIMAMDVNLDGKVSAGDVSQINQRTVKNPAYKEFWQKWNYTDAGVNTGGESFDWTWLTEQDYLSNATRISDNYPLPDSKNGYHKNNVYMWGAGKDLRVENPLTCPIIYDQEFQGIMLGDVDGSYKNIKKSPDPDARPGIKGEKSSGSDEKPVSAESAVATTGKVVFDLSKAIVNDGFITFPVSLSAEIDVNSLDFAMKFDESKLAFKSVFNHLNNLQSLGYYNESDKTLRVTSFSLQRYTNEASVISLRFELKDEKISSEDIKSVTAYINGNPAGTELTEFDLSAKELDEKILRVFPNPAKSVINVELSENATVQLVDINGKVVLSGIIVNAYQRREISLDGLSQGMYLMKFFMKIGDEEYVAIRKIVIKK